MTDTKYTKIQTERQLEMPWHEELEHDPDTTKTSIVMPLKQKFSNSVVQTTAATLALILFYFALSIGLTFYQRWLLTVSKKNFIRKFKIFSFSHVFVFLLIKKIV